MIEGIARCGDAKAFAIARAEALNSLLIHQCFDGGQDIKMFNLIDAALVRWVETANAFNFIAEEIENLPASPKHVVWHDGDLDTP